MYLFTCSCKLLIYLFVYLSIHLYAFMYLVVYLYVYVFPYIMHIHIILLVISSWRSSWRSLWRSSCRHRAVEGAAPFNSTIQFNSIDASIQFGDPIQFLIANSLLVLRFEFHRRIEVKRRTS